MLFVMKNSLINTSLKLVVLGTLGVCLSLAGFWEYSKNQHDFARLSLVNQGVSTCWARISQTFTALMIKDVQSAYLDRGFLGISDECLSEVSKDSDFLKNYLGKKYNNITNLVSEVNWFHELVLKVHGPMLSGKGESPQVQNLVDKYSKSENLKLTIGDDLEATLVGIQKVSLNNRYMIGLGLLMVVFSITGIAWIEFRKNKILQSVELEALSLLGSGEAKLGAMVDALMIKALSASDLKVTSQIFRDYHENLLELLSRKNSFRPLQETVNIQEIKENTRKTIEETVTLETTDEAEVADFEKMPKCSLKEILVSIENLHTKDKIQVSDFRDAQGEIEQEACEQIFNNVINLLGEKRTKNTKVLISNQVHSDKVVVNFFLSDGHFQASELEFMEILTATGSDHPDMNLVILKELLAETKATIHLENKADKQGKIIGASIRLMIKRASKEKSKLVSLVRGKKKDLSKELMN